MIIEDFGSVGTKGFAKGLLKASELNAQAVALVYEAAGETTHNIPPGKITDIGLVCDHSHPASYHEGHVHMYAVFRSEYQHPSDTTPQELCTWTSDAPMWWTTL